MNVNARILIVDNDTSLLRSTARLFRAAGFEVLETNNTKEGLRLAKEDNPNLVLYKIALPSKDLLEAFQHIDIDADLADSYAVLLSTSKLEEQDREDGHSSGINEDSVAHRELIGRVETVLRLQQTNELLQAQVEQLQEQVKILDCLNSIPELVQKPGISLDEILQGIVELIPPARQYPEITCARLSLDGKEFKTADFQETAWRQASDIQVRGETAGRLEVFHREEKPERDEGPFSAEERNLLDTIASRVGHIVERVQARASLQENAQKFRGIFEQSQDGIVLTDEAGTIIEWNRAMEQIVGLKAGVVLGKPVWDAQFQVGLEEHKTETWYQQLKSMILAALESGQAPWLGQLTEREYIPPDGTHRFMQWMTFPIQTDKGFMLGSIARDITEPKKMEQALAETTLLLETIFNNTPMLIASLDPQFNFVSVNKAYAESDDREPSFFPGKNHFDLYPNAENQAIFQQVVETGQPHFAVAKPFEYTEHPERGVTYWDWSLVPVKNIEGAVTGLVFTLADVTERIQAREELRASEKRFRSIFLQSPIGIELYDAAGKLVDVNPVCLNIFGVDSIEEVRGFDLFMDPNLPPEAKAQLEHGGKVAFETRFDFELVKQQGLYKTSKSGCSFIDCLVTPLEGAGGYPSGFLVHVRDISDQMQARAALEASERRYRSLFEQSLIGMVSSGPDSRLIAVNPAVIPLLGYNNPEELLGQPAEQLWFDPEERSQKLGKAMDIGHLPIQELRVRKKDGTPLHTLATAVIDRDPQGEFLGVTAMFTDITDLKQTEDALRVSEKLLRTIAANYPAYLSIIEKDLTIGFTSGKEFTKRNLDPDDYIGLKLEEVFGEHTSIVRENYLKAFRGKEVSFELYIDNQYQRYNILPLYNENGEVEKILAVVENITQRVESERALRESEEKYRTLVEQVNDVIYAIDSQGIITYVSPAIESFIGYSPSEVLGRSFAQFIAPEDLSRVNNGFQQLSSGETPGLNEYRLMTKSGEIRWMRTSSQPVTEKDQVIEIRGVLTDITQRKQMEETLRASQQLLQSVLDALSANIAVVDESGNILAVNASWRAFGDQNDITWGDYGIGRNYLEVLDAATGNSAEGADEAATGLRELLAGQREEFSLGYPCHSPDEERWFVMQATRFENAQGPRLAISHENVTERKLAERQLEQAAATAERERLARELHDAVTQALFSASLIADTLPRVWEKHPLEGERGLEEIRRLTHGALAEMRALLIELRPGALSEQKLGVLLRQLADGMMARTRMAITTTVVGDGELPAEVRVALYRIAQEALNNVAKHAVASRAALSLQFQEESVSLGIRDNGHGFDTASTQVHQLGVHIMRERAQAIGASLDIQSQPGRGTQLTVTWPSPETQITH